uniref:Uncharacterized protein n=1 Tax=Ditylenchus dipsaci TaxID=166011 RepID=A0A915EH06_9BILA
MSEEDTSNRVSLSIVDMTSQASTSMAVDSEKATADLKKQIVALQSENATLKRQMPRMKDMEGNDITEQMKQLCDDLAMQSRATRTGRTTLEEENEKLKKQAENDQSKIFHLQNDGDTSEQHNLSIGEFDRSYESDTTTRIKQELAEKVEENAKLSHQLEQTILLVESLKKTIEKQAESLKLVADLENDSIFAMPKLSEDLDNAVANVLFLIQQLDNNERESNNLRDQLINFLRNKGYPIDEKNIGEMSKELENTFRTKFDIRRKEIKKTNEELAKEYRFENSEMERQLNLLSEDSLMFSSTANQLGGADPQTSFAVDLG